MLAELLIAFLGDQDLTPEAIKVLQLAKQEKASYVFHQGDFDYHDQPDLWFKNAITYYGKNYIASLGNHDLPRLNDYKKEAKNFNNSNCKGDILEDFICDFGLVGAVFISVGLTKTLGEHEKFLDKALSDLKTPWKICSWHLNQNAMQVGGKPDGTGWGVYNICKKHGAIIVTGHEHSYSRTYTLTSFEPVAFTKDNKIEKGRTVVIVSGIGGRNIRPQVRTDPYWAKVYSATQNAKAGALFCNFKMTQANCYFKTIQGEVIESFTLTL